MLLMARSRLDQPRLVQNVQPSALLTFYLGPETPFCLNLSRTGAIE